MERSRISLSIYSHHALLYNSEALITTKFFVVQNLNDEIFCIDLKAQVDVCICICAFERAAHVSE